MAYIAGNYDPANPPADDGSATAKPAEEIHFNPDEIQNKQDGMGQAEHDDDVADMLNAMGDGEVPAVERSSIDIGA